jgi:hypothetical protein
MGDHHVSQERLLKELVGTFRCQFCRRSFERDQVRVAARHEQLWIVSVRCSLCRNQQVFWVALKDNRSESGREISPEEEEYFSSLPPVGTDEILDIHQFLNDFNGDFTSLFAPLE